MNILQKLLYLSVSASLLLANSSASNKDDLNAIQIQGEKSATLLLKTLGKNMKQHMKHGGPMEALDFCSTEAFSLTQKVNAQLDKGVSVKRISSKYRSTANRPSKDELRVLEAFTQKENKARPEFIIKKIDANTYKYYKPLIIKKQVCLKCHGNLKDGTLKSEIQSRYPNDKAMAYKMGDLRGAVVVSIKKQ